MTDRLISALTPAFSFYNTLTIHYFMTKDRDQINGNGFFALDRSKDLSMDLCEKDMGILKEAQSIMLHISLQGVKSIYKMKNTPIHLKGSLIFENSYYVFNGKTYKYGEYPTQGQINDFVNDIKNHVLDIIQHSAEDQV